MIMRQVLVVVIVVVVVVVDKLNMTLKYRKEVEKT